MYYEKPFGGRIKKFLGPTVRRQRESSHGCWEQVWMIRSPGGPGPAESACLYHCTETTVCSSLLQPYGDICKTKQEPRLIVSNWAVDLEVSCPWFLCWERASSSFLHVDTQSSHQHLLKLSFIQCLLLTHLVENRRAWNLLCAHVNLFSSFVKSFFCY